MKALQQCKVEQGISMYDEMSRFEYDLESDLDHLYDLELECWSTFYSECSLNVPWKW